MLSARSFYELQKLQLQGKLVDNPTASALVAKVTENLAASEPRSLKSGHGVSATTVSASTLSSYGNANIQPKKSRKRKRKSRTEIKSNTFIDVNRLFPAIKLNEISTEPSNHDHQASRSHHRRLRKKLRKLSETAKDDLSPPEISQGISSANATDNTKRPRSPHPPHVCGSSGKQPCAVLAQTTVAVTDRNYPRKLESRKEDYSELEHSLQSPIDMGEKELHHILAPVSIDEFFRIYFEKQPLFLQRKPRPNDWLSVQDLDTMLREERVMFTEHMDVVSYRDGQRLTLNPPGRAFRPIVWDLYNSGCSLRLLCPQLFFKHIRYRLSLLHEYFGCFVGCNVYLTPPRSQGFAPHYDDIEAFILQLEGSKRWRVYAPRHASAELPREPSPNFTQEELGEPTLTAVLTPGDLLYLPRGYVHQGETNDDAHSLHVTVSTYQKHTWGDFMSKLMPVALQTAMESKVAFRQGLPVGILRHVGGFVKPLVARRTETSKLSGESKPLKEFRSEVVSRLRQLADLVELPAETSDPEQNGSFPHVVDPLLSAADLFAVDLIGQALPPQLQEDELACHVLNQEGRWKSVETEAESVRLSSPGVVNVVELRPDTKVRLVRWSAVRAVRTRLTSAHSIVGGNESSSSEEYTASFSDFGDSDSVVAVYHSLSNTNVFRERELEEMALDAELLPALDYLAREFPNFVPVDSLPLSNPDAQLRTAIGLYENGLLVTSNPVPITEDETDSGAANVNLGVTGGSMVGDFFTGSVDLDKFVTSGEEEERSENSSVFFEPSKEPSEESGTMPAECLARKLPNHTKDGKGKRKR